MSDLNDLLSRIDKYLATGAKPAPPVAESLAAPETVSAAQTANAAAIRSSLSGAFGEAIEVYIGEGVDAGAYLALVPLVHLRASGLRLVESVIRPRVANRSAGTGSRAMTGSAEAIENAERRVTKFLGDAWVAKLDSFPLHEGAPEALYFRITATDHNIAPR